MGPVPAHGSYARTNTVTLPPVDAGMYYVFVQVNPYGQLYESATTNNVLSAPIQVEAALGLADLVPVSLTAPPSAAPGQTIPLSYTVGNLGAVPVTGSWMDVIWFSTNAVWDDTATFLAFGMQNGPVTNGGSYVCNTTAKLPTVAVGTYYLILQVDMAAQVYEVNDDNNTRAQPILLQTQAALPDLAPLALTTPGAAASGQTIEVSYAVTNRGTGTALGSWYDEWALSTNTVWDTNDYLLAVQPRSQPVAAGASYRATNNLPLPAWSAGTYYLLLNVDAFASLGESAETNNVLWAPISLTAPAIAPSLGAGRFLSDWRFQLAVTGALGTNYTLQASTNLAQWVRVLDLSCTGSPTYVVDLEAKNFSRRFYRVAPFTGSPPLRLDFASPAWRVTSGLALKLDGPLGKNYRIDASTNLLNWVPITNLPNTWVPFYFSDPQSTNYQRRFYRALAP
jgi:hypothetical protein